MAAHGLGSNPCPMKNKETKAVAFVSLFFCYSGTRSGVAYLYILFHFIINTLQKDRDSPTLMDIYFVFQTHQYLIPLGST
ncbi:MAG: hypothetical protein ACI9AR_000314, partial [Flavobacteriaceae bacterium]